MKLTQPVIALLGLPQNFDEDHVRIKVDGLNSTNFDGLFSSPESRDCFLNCLLTEKKIEDFQEFPIPSDFEAQQKWSISINQQEFLEVLVFPNAPLSPPLEIEEWIFYVFLNGHIATLSSWRTTLSGKGITFRHVGTDVSAQDANLCQTLAMGILERSVVERISPLIAARGINLRSGADRHRTPSENELLADSLREVNPKWRFLSLYRTVEHIYVGSVLKRLTADFYGSPKDAVASAAKSLEAEVEQLRLVVEENKLHDRFIKFADQFDMAAKKGEQLPIAIQLQIRSKDSKKKDAVASPKWILGVRYCYQIRCAIAHAGQATAFVEKYPNWRRTLESLCPELEIAVLQLFRVELIR